MIDVNLETTRKATDLRLTFSNSYPELFAILPNVTSIGIENLNDTQFNYTLTQDPSIDTLFHLKLIYDDIVLSRPLLTMILSPPASLKPPRERALSNYNLTAILLDYYELSESEEKTVDDIWNYAEYIYKFYFPGIFVFYAIFSPGNSFAIRGTLSIFYVHYLKLIAASYPPYASALFDTNFAPFHFIPEVSFD